MTGNLDTDTGTLTGRKPCDDEGRDRSDAFIGQGMPRIAGKLQKLKRGKEGSCPRAFRGSLALPTPDVGFLVFRSVRAQISVV